MDDVERAGRDDAVLINATVVTARTCARADRWPAKNCADCGEKIQKERRVAMDRYGMPCERCTACQTELETRDKKGS